MAGNSDLKAHEETYASVMAMLKWGTVACALVGALVIVLIST
jgi:Bacterial aa3 type cytochrome c oxidase subunit IV